MHNYNIRHVAVPLFTALLLLVSVALANAASIKSPADAFKLAQPEIGQLQHEEAIAYFVDSEGEVLKEARITQHRKGGIYYVPWELIFGTLLPGNTEYMYLIHNHPSGNPNLSEPDVELGSFWASEAQDKGVTLDLLAITSHKYTSLQESGRLLSPDQLKEKKSAYLSFVVQPGLKILGSGVTKIFADNGGALNN